MTFRNKHCLFNFDRNSR